MLLTSRIKAISNCRQRKLSQPVNQNTHDCKRCLETSRANSLLVQAKGVFKKLHASKGRKRVNVKFCLADFVYLIQKPNRRALESLYWGI